MPTSGSFYRDANRVPIWTDGIITKKSITFDGDTTDAWGNDGGVRNGGILFWISGLVYIRLVAICTSSISGDSSTGEVGFDNGNEFMPTTTMTNLSGGEIWLNNATPAAYFITGEQQAAADNLPEYMIYGDPDSNSAIFMTTGVANTTAGSLDFYAIWRPISPNAEVRISTIEEETES